MEYKKIVILIILVVFAASCKKEALFFKGNVVSKNILLHRSHIEKIEIQGIYDVVLKNSDSSYLTIECGEYELSHIFIDTSNVINISDDLKYRWSRDYSKAKITVYSQSISIIHVYLASSITSSDTITTSYFEYIDFGKYSNVDVKINCQTANFQVSSNNFSEIKVAGEINQMSVHTWGSSFFDGSLITSQKVYIQHKSISNCIIGNTKTLEGTIEHSGNIILTADVEDLKVTTNAAGKILAN